MHENLETLHQAQPLFYQLPDFYLKQDFFPFTLPLMLPTQVIFYLPGSTLNISRVRLSISKL